MTMSQREIKALCLEQIVDLFNKKEITLSQKQKLKQWVMRSKQTVIAALMVYSENKDSA